MRTQEIVISESNHSISINIQVPIEPILEMISAKITLEKPEPSKVDIIFGVKEAAGYLQVSETTIYRMVKAGRIPFIRRGTRLFFKQQSLNELNVETRLQGGKI